MVSRAWNGTLPIIISNASTPADQKSTAAPYPLACRATISGAMYT